MKNYVGFTIRTTDHTQMIDITLDVQEAVNEIGVQNGVCTVFIPHTTAAVTINENADPDVVSDLVREINRIVPWEDGYRHREGNAAAHIKASLIGCSARIIVESGQLVLGTWQGIYFTEFDGPRTRKVLVSVVGNPAENRKERP